MLFSALLEFLPFFDTNTIPHSQAFDGMLPAAASNKSVSRLGYASQLMFAG